MVLKDQMVHQCTECGTTSPKWVGRCTGCDGWGTVETSTVRRATRSRVAPSSVRPAVPLTAVETAPMQCRSTGVGELDRVLGGGLAPGSVTLLGGEPGIGKSTLALQVLLAMAALGDVCLLVSAEESATQVRLRAGRLGPLPEHLLVLADTNLAAVAAAVDAARPVVVVVDSIQTVCDPDVGTAAGSVAQVRACAQALTRLAKDLDIAVILVGHVTKDGALAGPRALEHVVDTVLSFEGDRHHALRLLRAVKHRFGPTGELGLFEMSDAGMRGVVDTGVLFLGDRRPSTPGSAIVAALEGRRPLLVEVQALAVAGAGAAGQSTDLGASGGWDDNDANHVSGVGRTRWGSAPPRRSAQGIDGGRLAQLLAVTERATRIRFGTLDVFVSAVGGVRLTEPAADLGIALALVSAALEVPVPADLVALGEVGLGGELRQVPHAAQRLAEAARHGFRRALLPASGPDGPDGLELIRAVTLSDAVSYLRRPVARPTAVG
jgi:DNA repair protein RadA/Sms